jgi:Mlc titration factor MtfA (ptsG expression regulator)
LIDSLPNALPFLVLLGFTAVWIVWLLGKPWFTRQRRARLRRQPFPAAWRAVLKERVPFVRRLPADLQLQLKGHIQVFLAEKAFIGCRGLVVTHEMRVTIAAQACLLILNRPTDYFPGLRQILVYPGPFIVNKVHTDSAGVLQDQRQVLAGESWSQGQVILSWQDVLEGAADVSDGRNVVIHEFAHQLDQENGAANGAPILAAHHAARWSQVMGEAYARLQAQTDAQQPSLINDYGATDPAEFFAVVSETFFEQAQSLAAEHPGLYREMVDFYAVDPLSW